ncbi:flagellar basal body P-ring formation chaperone FlgA [Cohaesibacter celericrescens]|uniref:Flagella basal body P-ring formation protein FlgA n=1 Tax=Cohaesibacter celericrescens TaxID=2067669 RepID=A0A2N5XWG7_9HYPH|nr:flagellar basal body P-ring formation chaperone FlgA [Cohaesibacter celericrescens]PLW78844.1 flagella basal body P-ring formation protein FlgA [Cohaesibacter celericrescens]
MRTDLNKTLFYKWARTAGALLAAILLFAAATTSNARSQTNGINQDPAKLQGHVVVSGKLVTLGDLFDNAGDVSHKAVFRAPSIGQSGTISASRVIEAARRAGLSNIASTTIQSVKVLRDSQLVSESDIVASLITQLRAKGYVSAIDQVNVELSTHYVDQHAASSAARAFDIRSLRFDRNSGRFTASLKIGGRQDLSAMRIAGRATETVLTPVMTRNIRRGDIITDSDITLTPMPKREVLLSKPAPMANVIGMAARQALRAGMIANSSYFTAPDIINRSDVVTILFQTGALKLSMRGKALMAGAKGDVITVQNLQTSRIIRGEIVGAGLLQINKPMNIIAALGANE